MASRGDPGAVRPRPPFLRALGRQEPPARVEIGGEGYHLVRVLKHDSWAATAVYASGPRQVVCKFNRQQAVGPVPLRWLGRWLARREARALRRLADLPGIPPPCGDITARGRRLPYAVGHEFIPGHPLGKNEAVNDAFFPELGRLLGAIHGRDMAYVDLHKRENVLVGDDGRPYLIDFQIGFSLPGWWPANSRPVRALLRVLQRCDRYHLGKHFAHCRPDQCGQTSEALAARRPWWIRLHRLAARPFRACRRRLLVLLGVRSGRGQVDTEHFPEEVVRADREANKAA